VARTSTLHLLHEQRQPDTTEVRGLHRGDTFIHAPYRAVVRYRDHPIQNDLKGSWFALVCILSSVSALFCIVIAAGVSGDYDAGWFALAGLILGALAIRYGVRWRRRYIELTERAAAGDDFDDPLTQRVREWNRRPNLQAFVVGVVVLAGAVIYGAFSGDWGATVTAVFTGCGVVILAAASALFRRLRD
jgi:hypothetical protein